VVPSGVNAAAPSSVPAGIASGAKIAGTSAAGAWPDMAATDARLIHAANAVERRIAITPRRWCARAWTPMPRQAGAEVDDCRARRDGRSARRDQRHAQPDGWSPFAAGTSVATFCHRHAIARPGTEARAALAAQAVLAALSPHQRDDTMPCRTCRHARVRLACIGLWLGAAAIAAPAMAAPQGGPSATDETAHTAAAVQAVDQHWLEAEESGDAAWLDGIVAHAAKNRGSDKMKQEVAAWQAAHPVDQQVTLQGATAILSFVSAAPATKGKLYSSDVFVYVGGRWRALYSAHTEFGK